MIKNKNKITLLIFLIILIIPNSFAITYYDYEKCSDDKQLGQKYDSYYCVKKGDWLSKIALKLETPIDKLIEINKIKDKDSIFIGQKIYFEKQNVPEKIVKAITIKKVEPKTEDYIYYEIQQGDTLIALYNRESAKLKSNQILQYPEFVQINREKGHLGLSKKDLNLIYPGEKLIIGKKSIPAVEPEEEIPPLQFVYDDANLIETVLTSGSKDKIESELKKFNSENQNVIALALINEKYLSDQEDYKGDDYETAVIKYARDLFNEYSKKFWVGNPTYNLLVVYQADKNQFLYYGKKEGLAEPGVLSNYIDVEKYKDKKEKAASKNIGDVSDLLEFVTTQLIDGTLIKKQNAEGIRDDAEAVASLSVYTSPPGAEIEVDDHKLDFLSPIEKLPLKKAGSIKVRLTHEDYPPIKKEIRILERQNNVINAEFTTSKPDPIDVLLVTTTTLQTDAAFDTALGNYRDAIRKEGLESEFVVLDSQVNIQKYGYTIPKLNKPIDELDSSEYLEYQQKIREAIRQIYHYYEKNVGKGFNYLIIIGGDDIIPLYFYSTDGCEYSDCRADAIDGPMGYTSTYRRSYDNRLLSDDHYGLIEGKEIYVSRMPGMKGDLSSELPTVFLKNAVSNRETYLMNKPTIITDSCGHKGDCKYKDNIDGSIREYLNFDSCEEYDGCYTAPPACPNSIASGGRIIQYCDRNQFYNVINDANYLMIISHGRYPWVPFLTSTEKGVWNILLKQPDYNSISFSRNPVVLVGACHGGALDITDEECNEVGKGVKIFEPQLTFGDIYAYKERREYRCNRPIEEFVRAGAKVYISSTRLSNRLLHDMFFPFITGDIRHVPLPGSCIGGACDDVYPPKIILEDSQSEYTIGEVWHKIKDDMVGEQKRLSIFYGDPTQKIKFMDSNGEDKKKILILTPDYPPYIGGVQVKDADKDSELLGSLSQSLESAVKNMESPYQIDIKKSDFDTLDKLSEDVGRIEYMTNFGYDAVIVPEIEGGYNLLMRKYLKTVKVVNKMTFPQVFEFIQYVGYKDGTGNNEIELKDSFGDSLTKDTLTNHKTWVTIIDELLTQLKSKLK